MDLLLYGLRYNVIEKNGMIGYILYLNDYELSKNLFTMMILTCMKEAVLSYNTKTLSFHLSVKDLERV